VIGVQTRDDLVANLPHRPAVVAEQTGLHFLLLCRPVLLYAADERHLAADVLPKQLVWLEQVVLVVLLEHGDARWIAQRSEMHRRGVDRRRDVHEPQVEAACGQSKIAHVADERDVRVVHRDGQIHLIVEARRVLSGHGRGGCYRIRLANECRAHGQGNRGYENGCTHVERLLLEAWNSGPLAWNGAARSSCEEARGGGQFLRSVHE